MCRTNSFSSRWPRVPPRRAAVSAVATCLLGVACAGTSPPAVPGPPPASDTCPLPLLRAAGRVQPSTVRLENRTEDTLEVWIDRCFRHTRLARVAPGGSRLARLPDELVAFREGLRFHAYDMDEARHVGVFVLPVDEVPTLFLVLSDSSRADEAGLTRVLPWAGAEEVDGWVVGKGSEGGAYAAVFSREGAVLTWACDARGGRHLTIGARWTWRAEEVLVRVRADGGPWRAVGHWRVQDGFSDSALAPDGEIARVTRLVLEAQELSVVVSPADGRGREAHAFRVAGLARALEGRACFDGIVGSG